MIHDITNAAYARQRELDERATSAAALDPIARDGHFMMAERYADRAWSILEASADMR
jgi:hypothetical protein